MVYFMSELKTYVIAALIGFCYASPVLALPYSPSQRAELFANCAGRLSALEEHQRMFDGPASEVTRSAVRRFEALLEAVMPDAIAYGMPGRQVWSWRVNAKHAQSLLLNKATFSQDGRLLERAQMASDQYISECENLVLGV